MVVPSKNWLVALRLAGTVCLLLVLFLFVPINQVVAAIRQSSVPFLAFGFVFGVLARFAAAERTFAISKAVGLPLSRAQTIEALFISNFWSLLLPGVSAGTVATVYRYRTYGCSLVESIGVLGASRIVELIVFSVIAATCFIAELLSGSGAIAAPVLSPWLVAAIGALLAVGVFWMDRYVRQRTLAAKADRTPLGKTAERISRLFAAFARMTPRAYAKTTTMAVVQCVLEAASLAVFAEALTAHIGLADALWINGIVYLAMLLPVSIAGLGARDISLITTTAPLGVSTTEALAVSMLMFALILLNAVVGGLIQLSYSSRYATAMKTKVSEGIE